MKTARKQICTFTLFVGLVLGCLLAAVAIIGIVALLKMGLDHFHVSDWFGWKRIGEVVVFLFWSALLVGSLCGAEWSELRPVTHYVMAGKIMVPVQRMEHECVGRK